MSCRAFGTALFIGFLLAAPVGTTAQAQQGAPDIGKAERIVSIGGAVTEILYALGLGDRIVAVDQTSTYPVEALEKPQVGYMRALSAEGVLSVAPDLVIAIEGSGQPDVIEILEHASIPFILVPEAHDGAGAVEKIRFIADLLGETEKGDAVIEALEADLHAQEAIRASIPTRRKAIFVLGMASDAPLVGGEGTAADAIFALSGVDNALSGFSGYKPANDEATMAAQPEAVILMAERAHELTPEKVFAAPAFAGTPAARDNRLIALSGSYLLNFGPRTAHAARDLTAAVYPELAIPELPARPWATSVPAPR